MIETTTQMQNPAVKTGYDMIYLVSCILQGNAAEKKQLEQMHLINLYRSAKKHSLTAMVYMALEAAGALSECKDIQLVKMWKDEKEKAIRKSLMFDSERKEITNFMEEKGIWYMPLKGVLLKEYYPKLGMREMADNDILYDKRFQKELLYFMSARGYKATGIGKGNHDVYQKAPVYNFELHTALYDSMSDCSWEKYYKNVKQRLIKDKDNQYGYHFREEDFYLYIVTHAYKHYSGGGTGIRSLIDVYLFLQQREAGLNWHYIGAELEELKIVEFERESRNLCKKLFSKKPYPLTQKEQEELSYYLSSGTYGTMKNSIEKKVRKYQPDKESITAGTKIKYYFKRFIPEMDHYKNYAPLVYRHKWLIPFYLVFRVIRGVLINRKKLQHEIQELRKIG